VNVKCICVGRSADDVQRGFHWSGCEVSKLPVWARRQIRNADEERRVASKALVRP
jgi:hypothetical protein